MFSLSIIVMFMRLLKYQKWLAKQEKMSRKSGIHGEKADYMRKIKNHSLFMVFRMNKKLDTFK